MICTKPASWIIFRRLLVAFEPTGFQPVVIQFHKPHRKTRALIQKLDPAIVKNAVAFGTYGNQFEIGEQLTNLLREQHINVVGEPFTCKGDSPGTDNKGHPNATDLQGVQEFARKIVSGLL